MAGSIPSGTPTLPAVEREREPEERLLRAALLLERLLATLPAPAARSDLRTDTLRGLAAAHADACGFPEGLDGALLVWEGLAVPKPGVAPATASVVESAAATVVAAIRSLLSRLEERVRAAATRDARKTALLATTAALLAAVLVGAGLWLALRPPSPEETLDLALADLRAAQAALRVHAERLEDTYGKELATDPLFGRFLELEARLERSPALAEDLAESLAIRPEQIAFPIELEERAREASQHRAAITQLDTLLDGFEADALEVRQSVLAGIREDSSRTVRERLEAERAAESARLARLQEQERKREEEERLKREAAERQAAAARERAEKLEASRVAALRPLVGNWEGSATQRGPRGTSRWTARFTIALDASTGSYAELGCTSTLKPLPVAGSYSASGPVRFQEDILQGQQRCGQRNFTELRLVSDDKLEVVWFDPSGRRVVDTTLRRQ